MKKFFQISKEAASDFFADDAMSLAAALALYTVIALAPLVTVMLTIAGLIFGDQASIGFVQQAEGLIGNSGAEAIKGIVENASKPSTGVLQAIIGFIFVLISASAVFAQLQSSLNRIWNVVQKPGLGILYMIKTRLFSMAVVASLGFLLMVSLGVSTATAYGAAGSFMVLILWLYYSTVILFFGAEWAQVRAKTLGNRFQPAEHANRLVVEARDANDREAESKVADKGAKERMSGY